MEDKKWVKMINPKDHTKEKICIKIGAVHVHKYLRPNLSERKWKKRYVRKSDKHATH